MRVLVLADLGQPVYHVGDEAMGIAAADQLRARGHEVVFATRSIEHSRRFIASGADYVLTLPFPWAPAERENYLAELKGFLAGEDTPAAPEFSRFVGDVSGVDAVLIAGGGNMNSRYGWLLYERAALGLVARHLGKPLVVSGQSVGPVLTGQDAGVLAELLTSAQLVGMREKSSQSWCRRQGILSIAGIDDATFYAPAQRRLPGESDVYLPERYLSVTFNGLSDEQVEASAALLDRVSVELGLTPVFVPHMGNPEVLDGDTALHQRVAAKMQAHSLLLPISHADTAVAVHRGAELVLTTRYHPAVLALAYGVPALALLPDAFTDIRLGGALAHFGLEDYALALDLLQAPNQPVFTALAELAENREVLSARLLGRGEELRTFETSWWDAVAAALAAAEPELPVLTSCAEAQVLVSDQAVTGWRELNAVVRPLAARLSLQTQQAEAELDRVSSYAR